MRWHRPRALRLHRSAAFPRLDRLLSHGLLGRLGRALARASRPRWAVAQAIRGWTERAAIRMDDLQPGPVASLASFLLRRLRPGARPIGDGVVAPADGVVGGAGPIVAGVVLQIKGVPLALERLTAGRHPAPGLAAYEGGRYIVLTPHGHHDVHMPIAGTVIDLRWLSGRASPQHHDALQHTPRIDEHNERVTLRCRSVDGHEFMLVLVGASLLGGIHLRDLRRRDWVRSRPFAWNRHFARGEELGHLGFGSTVVLLVPPALAGLPPPLGMALRMGQHLW